MNCQTIREQFDERLDERLGASECAAFDGHVVACGDCRREWTAYAGAWTVLEHQKGIEPSFGFAKRTLRRLEESPVTRPSWLWLPVVRWAGLAAVLVVAGVGGWVRHEAANHQRAEIYARVQEADYLEDYDVIANLDQVMGDNKL